MGNEKNGYSYRFSRRFETYSNAQVDIVAFVALEVRQILYCEAVPRGGGGKNFGMKSFIQKAVGSFERIVDEVMERCCKVKP